MRRFPFRNERGVALLIVLLVTALLVALVFEFAYDSRVSLRAAANFRDSQRAYYLARSGVNFAGRLLVENKKNGNERDSLEQREWLPVPFIAGEGMLLQVRWEDECGKINIGTDSSSISYLSKHPWREWFKNLLENSGIAQGVVDKIRDEKGNRINLVPELHQFLAEEEYAKVESDLTVISDGKINVNTASEAVLKSVLAGKAMTPETILMKRKNEPITTLEGTDINLSLYSTTSNYFRVQSSATVGEFTQVVEAVISRDPAVSKSPAGFAVLFWRIL